MISCKYLLAYRGTHPESMRVKPHSHPFWQIDICLQGSIVLAGKKDLTLQPQDMVIIPPHTDHELGYPEDHTSFAVLKFTIDGIREPAPVKMASALPYVRQIGQAIVELLPEEELGEPIGSDQHILEPLIAALMQAHYGEREESPPTSARESLVLQLKTYVQNQGGRYVTLSDLARHLNYSISHLSAEFRKQEAVSLKSYLDQERASSAMRLIQYSDYSIPNIAEKLDFPDLHGFSRFIKRMTGKSPRDHRM